MPLHELVIVLLSVALAAQRPAAVSECQEKCGDVEIPYPFGIGQGCAMFDGFELSCNDRRESSTKPFHGDMEVLNISLLEGRAWLRNRIYSYCTTSSTTAQHLMYSSDIWSLDLTNAPFRLRDTENMFIVLGCPAEAYIGGEDQNGAKYISGCTTNCSHEAGLKDGHCSGIGCCQMRIPTGFQYYQVRFAHSDSTSETHKNATPCRYAALMEASKFEFFANYATSSAFYDTNSEHTPFVVDWAIGNETCKEAKSKSNYACISSNSECFNSTSGGGYICNCSKGFQGNPYILDGCQDIDECKLQISKCPLPKICSNTIGDFECLCPNGSNGTCAPDLLRFPAARLAIGICACIFGVLTILLVIQLINHKQNVKRQKIITKREKYFQQHGGQLLSDMMKIERNLAFVLYTIEDIETATNNFNQKQIIGEGGQGTVYKGILDNTLVAIKRCKGVDENRRMEFGQELLILCRVNHPNIVKFLGCCLQFEVPILVYEFVPNKTLYDLIHGQNRMPCITLATRLRIAAESAEALAYLHSLSHPIFHGDVKSANILLGEDFEVKVSDFGSSMITPMNEEVQVVKGTLGYLDPEYLQSYQLTDKSDVYSFTVIILELLTRKTPRSKEKKSLVSVFQEAVREGTFDELVDQEIVYEDNIEVIHQVVELASCCLVMSGERRPTMKQVAQELQRLARLVQTQPHPHPHPQMMDDLSLDELGSSNTETSVLYPMENTSYFSFEKKATLNIEFS